MAGTVSSWEKCGKHKFHTLQQCIPSYTSVMFATGMWPLIWWLCVSNLKPFAHCFGQIQSLHLGSGPLFLSKWPLEFFIIFLYKFFVVVFLLVCDVRSASMRFHQFVKPKNFHKELLRVGCSTSYDKLPNNHYKWAPNGDHCHKYYEPIK